ncbi:hypothetical protein CYMTET_40832 [Cymbomonas tetramitiformis]|uniref:Uncharacterized protein n=1 Tax=Cymbomonas tetramitiformis TaxID=36881 RepID=A0AAE0C8L1_9CHLO|nr:hypothetical protein CYMTET_40832 [Cymbomonas tetramitiformis]
MPLSLRLFLVINERSALNFSQEFDVISQVRAAHLLSLMLLLTGRVPSYCYNCSAVKPFVFKREVNKRLRYVTCHCTDHVTA